MCQQNAYGFARNELHPQKLVQLVAVVISMGKTKSPSCFSLKRESRLQC